MGLGPHYEGQRQMADEQRALRRREKASGRRIDKPGVLTRFLINRFMPDIKEEGKEDIRSYVELDVAQRQRLFGTPLFFAVSDVRKWRKCNPDSFQERATEFLDYKRTLTQGEWGISEETFQHCLNANPSKVLQDALFWAIDMRAMRRGAPEAGPTTQQ